MLQSLDTLIAFALIFTVVSLLITILVQIVTSLLNLRGKNLAWGIAEAFEAIAPELTAKANEAGKKLADHILKDCLISDSQLASWSGKASAVRAEELFALLHSIAVGKRPGTPPEIRARVITLFRSLGVPSSVFEMAEDERKRLEALKTEIAKELATLPPGPIRDHLEKVKAEAEFTLARAAASVADIATRWATLGEAEIQKIYQQFEQWFEIGQERSQEWFTTHTRIITGCLGLIAAFVLQLDTVEIYKLVSSNGAVRDSLVAQTKVVLDQGEKLLKDRQTVIQAALEATCATNARIANLTNQFKITTSDTVGMVKTKIQTAATNLSSAQVEKMLADFDKQVSAKVATDLKALSWEYNTMAKSLDKTGFDLFPKEGWRWGHKVGRGFQNWWDNFSQTAWSKHTLGMIFSALLLSLGAPFWFNTLKSLASLRSSVAKNISSEEMAAQKAGNDDQPGKAPPTVK